jgi:hypothetical protein
MTKVIYYTTASKEVGKIIELPQGETPSVATVSDVSKLVNQPFFKNALNGDRVLVYTQAKKTILYRPSARKVIETAPVTSSTPTLVKITPKPTDEAEETPTRSPSPTLVPPTSIP